MSNVLIIGGGQAGCMTAVNLRKQRFKGSITIITKEAHLPYQKPPLSKGFLKGASKIDAVERVIGISSGCHKPWKCI